jgi:ABC-type nitrate/sulfonate/bicarbonate transport system substrate-binding protein
MAWGRDEGLNFTDYVFYSEALVNDRERALAVMRSLIEAADYCAREPAETAKSAAKAFRLSESEARGYVDKLTFKVHLPKKETQADLEDWGSFCQRVGLIKQMPNLAEFIRPEFIKQIAPDRAVGW